MPNNHRVTKYLDKKSGFWHLNYFLNGERCRPSTTTKNRKLAELKREDTEKQLILGKLCIDPIISVETALNGYLLIGKTNGKTKKSLTNDECLLNGCLTWLGVKSINDVTTTSINDYIAHKIGSAAWAGAPSIRRFRESIHSFFEYLRTLGLSKNPVDDVPCPKLPERDIVFLPSEKIAICIRAVAETVLEAIVATAIFAGLRRDEIVWLTHEDVILDERKPLIRICSKTIDGETWLPKNKKNRTVPVSRALYPYLVQQKLKSADSKWFFRSPEGRRWYGDTLGHRLSAHLGGHNLPWTFIELRHTFGSHLAQKGVSFDKIALLMGNSARVVKVHYAHLEPEAMHAEVEFGSATPEVLKKEIL